LTEEVEFIMGTYSKALGGFGAYLAASRTVVDYLINAARSFVYSTALPAAVIAADLAAVRLCLSGLERGPVLLEKAGRFRETLRRRGWTVPGASQIVPVLAGESGRALGLAERMGRSGFRVIPVRPPTVPRGQARLRFSLCYAHTDGQLEAAAEALGGPE